MKPVFNIDNYPDDEYVMHCATLEEANLFLNYLAELGLKWADGVGYNERDNMWDEYRGETGYCFNMGKYANIDWYIDEGFTVLHCCDFIIPDTVNSIEAEEDELFGKFISEYIVV